MKYRIRLERSNIVLPYIEIHSLNNRRKEKQCHLFPIHFIKKLQFNEYDLTWIPCSLEIYFSKYVATPLSKIIASNFLRVSLFKWELSTASLSKRQTISYSGIQFDTLPWTNETLGNINTLECHKIIPLSVMTFRADPHTSHRGNYHRRRGDHLVDRTAQQLIASSFNEPDRILVADCILPIWK